MRGMTNVENITECQNCANCAIDPGVGFMPVLHYSCTLTGRSKHPHGFCDEAAEGTPQIVGQRYDVDLDDHSAVWGSRYA